MGKGRSERQQEIAKRCCSLIVPYWKIWIAYWNKAKPHQMVKLYNFLAQNPVGYAIALALTVVAGVKKDLGARMGGGLLVAAVLLITISAGHSFKDWRATACIAAFASAIAFGLSIYLWPASSQSATQLPLSSNYLFCECGLEKLPATKIWTLTAGGPPQSGPVVRGILGTHEGPFPPSNGFSALGIKCTVANMGSEPLLKARITFPMSFQGPEGPSVDKWKTEPAIEIPTLLEPGKAKGFSFYVLHPGGPDTVVVHPATKAVASLYGAPEISVPVENADASNAKYLPPDMIALNAFYFYTLTISGKTRISKVKGTRNQGGPPPAVSTPRDTPKVNLQEPRPKIIYKNASVVVSSMGYPKSVKFTLENSGDLVASDIHLWGYRLVGPDPNATEPNLRIVQTWPNIDAGQTTEFTLSNNGPMGSEEVFSQYVDKIKAYNWRMAYIIRVQYNDAARKKTYLAQFSVGPSMAKSGPKLTRQDLPNLNWEREISYSDAREKNLTQLHPEEVKAPHVSGVTSQLPPAGQASIGPSGNQVKRFRVALSFPGEKRGFVEEVANHLAERVGRPKVFYDNFYKAELAKPNLDIALQATYHTDADLVVVFLCAEYEQKEWCGLEWRAVRDMIKRRRDDEIMFFRFDNADITGLLSIDGFIDATHHTSQEVANFILERLESC